MVAVNIKQVFTVTEHISLSCLLGNMALTSTSGPEQLPLMPFNPPLIS